MRDPFDNLWWIHTRIEEVTAGQMQRWSDPEFMATIEYVQSAAAAFDPAAVN